jgi:hypothetical protein
MPKSRPSGLGMTFLLGGILLSVLLGGVLTQRPLVVCPKDCLASREFQEPRVPTVTEIFPLVCSLCENDGKVSLFRYWSWKRNAPAR